MTEVPSSLNHTATSDQSGVSGPQEARADTLIDLAARNCAANGVSGPTRLAEIRRDGHCE